MSNYPNWEGWTGNRTVIIAEVGINHGGDEALAWDMILSAHKNGADFVKLQSFITNEFFHPSLSYYSDTESMELSSEAQTKIYENAAHEGIKLITTPYDISSVDTADRFNPYAHKIASMDNNNERLISYIAKKQRPVIVSCGMASLSEIHEIVNLFQKEKNDKLVLLHCVSNYPTKAKDLNLSMIPFLKETFNVFVGFSDHSIGLDADFIAISLGASIIEKHFTIDRSLANKYPEADHDISIEPDELKRLREFSESASVMLGKAPRIISEEEVNGRLEYRRGIYASLDIHPGRELTEKNTIFLRPVRGIEAGLWKTIKGQKAKRFIPSFAPVVYSDIGL